MRPASLLPFLLVPLVLLGQETISLEPEEEEAVAQESAPRALPYERLEQAPEPVLSLAVSPRDGTLAVVLGSDRIELWNPLTRKRQASAPFDDRYPAHIRFLRDGRRLAIAGSGLWFVNARTLAVDKTFPRILPDTDVTAFEITRDQRTAILGDRKGWIHLVDLRTGRERTRIKAHDRRITGIGLYAQETRIVSLGEDKVLKLWDLKTLTETRRLERPYPPDFALARSPDARWMAMGGLSVDLFDTRTEAEVSMVDVGHRGMEGGLVTALAFSGDGAWLASGGCDRIINVWDTRTRKILSTFEGTGDQIEALAFSRDRKWLFSGDRNGVLAAWPLKGLPVR